MLGVLVVPRAAPGSRVPRMIVSLWMAFIAARKGRSVHPAADDTSDGPAMEFDAFPMGEEQISRLLRRMLDMWTRLWAGQGAEPRAEPRANEQAERTPSPPASPHPSSPSSQDDASLGEQMSEEVFLKDTVHIFRWSKARRMNRVSSMVEDEKTENRLEQTQTKHPDGHHDRHG
ncbi:uncharacterized protein LOC110387791 isoform X2 [Numida meleagris]|uniref:uncharacterized protein LOC110387791 isoform X2 n=1 Tax=Numida meleagris TaxID=8996 RepID=UPI000B3E0704|nr:uncharacterized protein LOC110387791 isoform X2 [Numida meleagris]